MASLLSQMQPNHHFAFFLKKMSSNAPFQNERNIWGNWSQRPISTVLKTLATKALLSTAFRIFSVGLKQSRVIRPILDLYSIASLIVAQSDKYLLQQESCLDTPAPYV